MKKLEGVECINENVTGIYYRIVAADAQDKVYSVIKDNKIKYADDITKEKIENDDVTLAFQAFCIEKAPFIADGKEELVSTTDAYTKLGRVMKYEPEASFETDENGDTVSISKYTGINAIVNIPKTINGKTVTKIGNNAFADCTALESIIIPNSVTLINETAFDNCDLTKLTIKGKAGSEAETYANSNGIKFEVIS